MKNRDALRKCREILEVNLEQGNGRESVMRHVVAVLRQLELLFSREE